jgi:ligand-binding sensor domain-containing protein
LEDSKGQIWIGTWNNGLYRYDPKTDIYYAYPEMNPHKSAHIIFEDSRNQIWVGTWGCGLQLLQNAYEPEKVSWRTYTKQGNDPNSLMYDIIYDIAEDTNNQTLWIGTRGGLSILTDEKAGCFVNYYPGESDHTISSNEVNSIIRDNQGIMWLGLLGGGINTVITRKPYFTSYRFDDIKRDIGTNSVQALFVDPEDRMWMGFRNYGLLQYDIRKHQYISYRDMEGFSFVQNMASVVSITQLSSHDQIWIGTYNAGITVYNKKAEDGTKIKEYKPGDAPWLSGWQVYVIYEDSLFNLWIGTDRGFTMLAPDNTYIRFDSLEYAGGMIESSVITDIKMGKPGEIWAASNNHGVFRIYGEGKNLKNYAVDCYSIANKKLNSANVSCIYKDNKNRIWVGSDGGGLSLFDRDSDSFIPVHKNRNLPGDGVLSIIEDQAGYLWLGTNAGLVKLLASDNLTDISFRLYTTSDGLCDNSFNPNVVSVSGDGAFFFGGHRGVNSFYPEQVVEESSFLPPVVTGFTFQTSRQSAY